MEEFKKDLEMLLKFLDEGVVGEENDEGEIQWDVDERLFYKALILLENIIKKTEEKYGNGKRQGTGQRNN